MLGYIGEVGGILGRLMVLWEGWGYSGEVGGTLGKLKVLLLGLGSSSEVWGTIGDWVNLGRLRVPLGV